MGIILGSCHGVDVYRDPCKEEVCRGLNEERGWGRGRCDECVRGTIKRAAKQDERTGSISSGKSSVREGSMIQFSMAGSKKRSSRKFARRRFLRICVEDGSSRYEEVGDWPETGSTSSPTATMSSTSSPATAEQCVEIVPDDNSLPLENAEAFENQSSSQIHINRDADVPACREPRQQQQVPLQRHVGTSKRVGVPRTDYNDAATSRSNEKEVGSSNDRQSNGRVHIAGISRSHALPIAEPPRVQQQNRQLPQERYSQRSNTGTGYQPVLREENARHHDAEIPIRPGTAAGAKRVADQSSQFPHGQERDRQYEAVIAQISQRSVQSAQGSALADESWG